MDIVKQSGAYDAALYNLPFWNTEVVYNETVYPLENADGTVPLIPLMYRADEIIAVRSTDLETLYTADVDYVCEDGGIRILPGSSIPTVAYKDFFFDEEKPDAVVLAAAFVSR